jgi:hypothetical protein
MKPLAVPWLRCRAKNWELIQILERHSTALGVSLWQSAESANALYLPVLL